MKKILLTIITLILLLSFNEVKAIEVNTFQELKDAINNNESEITIKNDFTFTELLTIGYDVTIDGDNHTISRDSSYLKGLFSVTNGYTLSLSNLTVDGGASGWYLDYDNKYNTKTDNTGYVRVPTVAGDNDLIASATLIANAGNLVLNRVTIENARCTIEGCAIRGAGNNTITDSLIKHNASSKNGGSIYATGGKTIINNTKFSSNAAGAGIGSETSQQGGAMYVSGLELFDVSNNTIFEDNYAQNNGGAFFVLKSNTSIENTTFRHNIVGNDGAAIDLSANTGSYLLKIEDSVFEKNMGLATLGQSMGTIWLEQWISTEDNPIVFKNIIFRENNVRNGAGIADNAHNNTYVTMENIEFYNNQYNSGGLMFMQAVNYELKNIDVHDNVIDNDEYPSGVGALIFARTIEKITIDGAKVYNNSSKGSGAGVYVNAGDVTLKNVEIYDNESREYNGGGIFVKGAYNDAMPSLTIIDSTISNNKAAQNGGGIFVSDNADVFSKITINNGTKIYDNEAGVAGDDFAYKRADDSLNDSGNNVTLDNISIAGITGIDGWYNDSEDNRYVNTSDPSIFNDYIDYNGSGLYLKAGGLNNLDYDLVDGENDDITPVVIQYGVPYVVTDEEPEKEGFTFVNWNTKPDGSGTTLTSGDSYDGSEGYILYAIYDENKYTIEYNLQGGENNKIVSVTNLYTTPFKVTSEEPTKEGYKFIEWNTKLDGSGVKLKANDIYDRSDGFTLYAIYEETKYTIEYNLQGGENSKIVSVTNPYTTPFKVTGEEPTKEGYKFIEWNTKADGSGIKLKANDTYDRSDGFTLYAIYEETEYTINYDLVGGTNEKIVSVTNPYTKEFNVTSEVPEKDVFKFIEWNTKADGSGISLNADEVYDRSDGFTLYAIYEKIEEERVPITSDNINTNIIMLILSSLLFTSCLYVKRKIFN